MEAPAARRRSHLNSSRALDSDLGAGPAAIGKKLDTLFDEVAALRHGLHVTDSVATVHQQPLGDDFPLRTGGGGGNNNHNTAHSFSSLVSSPRQPHFSLGPHSYRTGMTSVGGRVPPPRVVELTVTKSPRREKMCETDDVELKSVTIEMNGGRRCKDTKDAVVGPDVAMDESDASDDLPPPPANRRVLDEYDVDQTETVQLKLTPEGKLGLQLREDMIFDHVGPTFVHQPCNIERLIGWRVTHINNKLVSAPSHVIPLLTPITTVRLQFVDEPFHPPSNAGAARCCSVM
ncbi:hypothetical protein DIPPA_32531 [Diplonema papillatum]|nr:hypothetical protein DIPPA_32531 [Diplonema papillatum]